MSEVWLPVPGFESKKKGLVLDYQAVADRHYIRIVAGAAA